MANVTGCGVDQHGVVLDILVQERRDQIAAEHFLGRVLESEAGAEPRVVITDKLASYPPAIRRALPNSEHRRHKGLNNRAENSHLPTRKRERILQRFKSAEHAQRFLVPFSAVSLPPPSPPIDSRQIQTASHSGTHRLARRHSGRTASLRHSQPGGLPPLGKSTLASARQLDNALPGSVAGLQVVSDIEAAHAELAGRGAPVSEIEDLAWGRFVYFSDPDGNRWAVQQLPPRR